MECSATDFEQKDISYMKLALDQALLGLQSDEVPVGCVFVHEPTGEIMAGSHNLTNQTKNATTHCEINCIREITQKGQLDKLKECVLYVTVEPCIMCAYALNLTGVKHVVFGCENDKFGGNGSILSLNLFNMKDMGVPKYTIKKGVMADEAIKLLQRFYEHGNEKAPEAKRQRKI